MIPTNTPAQDLFTLLTPGMKLSAVIEFGPKDHFNFNSSYLGGKLDQYLILEFPVKAKEQLIMRKVANTRVVVRGVSDTKDGDVIAFKTSTLTLLHKHVGLLFVRFPQNFASKALREHERYKVDITAKLEIDSQMYEAKILDISLSGAALIVDHGEEIHEHDSIKINCGLDKFLSCPLQCEAMTVTVTKQGTKIGAKFNEVITLSDSLKAQLLQETFNATSPTCCQALDKLD